MTRASGSVVETRASATGRLCPPRPRARALAASRSGRASSAARTLASRSRAARDPSARGGGIVVELVAQDRHLRRGILESPLQAAPAAVAAGPRRRAHPDPVVGDPLEGHLAAREERRHALGEEVVEQLGVRHPEVGEGVVVDADPAADPAVGVVLVAQAVEGPGAAHPLERGVQPERHEDRRVDRRTAAVALRLPDLGVEGRQVEALDERPCEASPVLGRQEALEIGRTQGDLLAAGPLESGPPLAPRASLGWVSAGGRSNSSSMPGIVSTEAQGHPERFTW